MIICSNPECGKEFTPRVGRQKFCQVKCQNRYFNQLRKGKPRFEISDKFIEDCKELRSKGLSFSKIADELNVSTSTVFRVLGEQVKETDGMFRWNDRCIITNYKLNI